MKNFNAINDIVAPYYNQFEQLGESFEEDNLDYGFLKKARRIFAKQCFFEIGLLLKAENRAIRREFKECKRLELEELKRSKTALKALKVQSLVIEPNPTPCAETSKAIEVHKNEIEQTPLEDCSA